MVEECWWKKRKNCTQYKPGTHWIPRRDDHATRFSNNIRKDWGLFVYFLLNPIRHVSSKLMCPWTVDGLLKFMSFCILNLIAEKSLYYITWSRSITFFTILSKNLTVFSPLQSLYCHVEFFDKIVNKRYFLKIINL